MEQKDVYKTKQQIEDAKKEREQERLKEAHEFYKKGKTNYYRSVGMSDGPEGNN